jgi:hypothetical protein
MSDERRRRLASALDNRRGQLVHAVARVLGDKLPIVGVPEQAADRAALHRQQMATTAERFHDMVQVALTIDWGLVVQEYAWSRRVLALRGVTWEHQQVLLDAYFAAAGRLGVWTEADRAALDEVAGRIHKIAADAWGGDEGTPSGAG